MPAPPFPDFQDIEGREQGNRLLRCLEAELERLSACRSVSARSGKFIYRALARETTRLLGDPRLVEYSWELDHEDAYSFLIAAACRRQVAVSQSCTNFPSIDQLRQAGYSLTEWSDARAQGNRLDLLLGSSSAPGKTARRSHACFQVTKRSRPILTGLGHWRSGRAILAVQATDIMPASTASRLPPGKAKEAVTRVIEAVLDFAPRAARPLWLALTSDAAGESRVNACNQWLWLTKDEIAALQHRPDPTKQKVIALSRGRHARVTRLKATRSDLRADPAWTDLDILKITCEEHVAFSRRYFSGQVTENPSPSPSPAERLMIERAADSAPLSSEPRKLLAIPTCVPPGKEAVCATLPTSDNVDSNAKENVELAASHSSFESADKAAPSTLFNVDPQLSLFHGGHQVVPAVKLKMTPYDTIGRTPLQTSDLSASATRTFSDELDSALSCDELSRRYNDYPMF